MILTVTLNPAVDMDYIVSGLRPGGRYRADVSRRSPGGAGINISIILSRLECPSVAMGFLAGFDGSYILDALRREGVSTSFVHTGGETRINVCIIDTDGDVETRLHGAGIEISPRDRTAFLRNYERILERMNMVCIGGSLPPGIDVSIYAEMMRRAKRNALPVVVHPTEGDLEAVLEEVPSVVKIDYQTSRLRTDAGKADTDAFMARAQQLHGKGIQWVIMSLCREKVAFSSPKGAWVAEGPLSEMAYVYATEDALIAGILAAMRERATPEDIIRFAMACNWECATHPEKFPKDRPCVAELAPRVLLTAIG